MRPFSCGQGIADIARLFEMQASAATTKCALRSLTELQDDFQPRLQKIEATTVTNKSALRSIGELQMDFEQSQRPHLIKVVHKVLFQRFFDERAAAAAISQVTQSEMPGPITTEDSLLPVYSRKMLLCAFKAHSKADCHLRDNAGLPSTVRMPQSLSRQMPADRQNISNEDDRSTNGDRTFEKTSGVSTSPELPLDLTKICLPPGLCDKEKDSTPTAAGDTASEDSREDKENNCTCTSVGDAASETSLNSEHL